MSDAPTAGEVIEAGEVAAARVRERARYGYAPGLEDLDAVDAAIAAGKAQSNLAVRV